MKIVIKCKYCGRIKRWGFWVRLTEKQEMDFCEKVIDDKVQILWTECGEHKR